MTKPPGESPSPASPFNFTPQEAIEFMQRMWNPFGVPMPGFAAPPPASAPTQPSAAAPVEAGTTSAPSPSAAPAGVPFAYPNPASMFMSLDPAEVERKIGELRVIEGWLAMSLNLMQMSIKTLELQKASLEALRGSGPKPEAGRSRT